MSLILEKIINYFNMKTIKDKPEIVRNPKIMGGMPTIKGTRLPVTTIVWHAEKFGIKKVLKDWPYITEAHINEAIHWWRDNWLYRWQTQIQDWFEENILWRIERIIDIPKDFYREIKYFIQRGRKGYCDRDLWGIDEWLSDILPKAIREFKKHNYGYPGYGEAKTPKQWNKILSEIANGFEAWNKIDKLPLKSKRYRKYLAQFNKGMKLFHKWYGGLWD